MTDLPSLLSAADLMGVLDADDVVVLDTTWATDAEKPRARFAQGHLPGARHFDHSRVHRANSDLHDTVCSPAQFAAYASELGIENHHRVVCYSQGMFSSAARAWWLFRLFGHDRVSILEGGLSGWEASGHPTTTESPAYAPTTFAAHFTPKHLCTYDELKANMDAPAPSQIVDARPAAVFLGERDFFAGRDSPARGRTGNISGSVNVATASLLTDGRLGDVDKVRLQVNGSAVSLEHGVVATCSLGVGAAGIAFALHLVGVDAPVFDGSWEEWAAQLDVS